MADRHTREQLRDLGYTDEEISRVFGGLTDAERTEATAQVQSGRDDGDGWTPWLLTSSSNVAAIRYHERGQELQVQFHPESVKKGVGRATHGGSAGRGHTTRGSHRALGGKRLPAGQRPHGHDFGNYPRFTAGSFSEGYGPIYGHYGVPESLWRQFESASDSYGEFYSQHLRNRYGVTRLS